MKQKQRLQKMEAEARAFSRRYWSGRASSARRVAMSNVEAATMLLVKDNVDLQRLNTLMGRAHNAEEDLRYYEGRLRAL